MLILNLRFPEITVMTKRLIVAALFLLPALFTSAQHKHNNPHWCATDEYREAVVQNNPDQQMIYDRVEEIIQNTIADIKSRKNKTNATVYTVPVVFHVIYNSLEDNITRAQVEDGMRVLNNDFRRMNADTVNTRTIFQNIAADIEIEFALAQKDPQGNCTEGITRTQSSLTVNARNNVKSLIQWDPDKYLNVWVVRSIENFSAQGIVLGFATFPGTNPSIDGIVIRHDQLGTIGTSSSEGRTLTHEVGHYLNLFHTFQGGCNGQGDRVSDTPPVANSTSGCPSSRNSCSTDFPNLVDMTENYMDYTDDDCVNMFSEGQKLRMRAVVESSFLRENLVSQQNLTETGVINPPLCQPEADFFVQESSICENDTIQFFDDSKLGTPTSWSWSFPGGIPASSTDQNPVVHYPNAGTYGISLTVSNSAGNNSITKLRHINVKSLSPSFHANWSENFEGKSQLPKPDLSVTSDFDNINFDLNNSVGQSSAQSISIDNFSAIAGDVDAVISPALYTTFTRNLNLSFDYAFAAKDNTNNDAFTVSVSINCGESWIIVRAYQGAQLRTASNTTSPFVPQNSSEWKNEVIDLSIYRIFDPILLKFELNGGGGNNFYLDNINFNSNNVGLDENISQKEFSVYPNPNNGRFTVEFTREFENDVDVDIYTIEGRKVYSESLLHTEGVKELHVEEKLPAGVYFIRLKSGKAITEEKIVVK